MWAVESLKFCTLMGSFCPNHVQFQLCLKNDMRNLMSFNLSSKKSENLHFDGIFLSKVFNVWAKTIQVSCIVKNDSWFQKWHKEFREFSHKQLKVMLDKSSNTLAQGVYFWTNVAHWISTFWTFHCLPEVIQIPHMIFEIWSQFCMNFAPFCNNLART